MKNKILIILTLISGQIIYTQHRDLERGAPRSKKTHRKRGSRDRREILGKKLERVGKETDHRKKRKEFSSVTEFKRHVEDKLSESLTESMSEEEKERARSDSLAKVMKGSDLAPEWFADFLQVKYQGSGMSNKAKESIRREAIRKFQEIKEEDKEAYKYLAWQGAYKLGLVKKQKDLRREPDKKKEMLSNSKKDSVDTEKDQETGEKSLKDVYMELIHSQQEKTEKEATREGKYKWVAVAVNVFQVVVWPVVLAILTKGKSLTGVSPTAAPSNFTI